MTLKILLPAKVFALEQNVVRIVAETPGGSFGILPRRLDCVAALEPGIFTYETDDAQEVFVAIDEGVLVKAGSVVTVSARRAIGGVDLEKLRNAVEEEFLTLTEHEQVLRSAMARLEVGFMRRLVSFHNE
ncbi:F0F1 ATP synthase subunit epsilon [Bradymonas sediminis]|uniref:F0F1 ATP synthase subunit epsilon n=1 Tax=Bradymonas sediminis TaxID=1548548 RepID=A0A2Z4FQW6_9DELT|nr:F0F1 ATP synthase subunit epsilon [Bradymonas sediminis]TDP73440.1 F-type H+-transporting ATPase subunit epsilon [Bradymonas sediminis]